MQKRAVFLLLVVFLSPLFLVLRLPAQNFLIIDILNNPSRFMNLNVTITGQVQSVQSNPPGSNRGTYTLSDESTPTTLTVRSNNLPVFGKTYKITGTIIQDPAQPNVPIMKELQRSSLGGSSTTTIIIVVACLALLVLLVVFLNILQKSKKTSLAEETIRASQRAASTPDSPKTRMTPPAAPAPAKTQVFMRLGASIIVDEGPDKGKEFTLSQLVTMIGRPGKRKNDIELTDDTVSKEQASIRYDNTKKHFSIVNESATNPTLVNNQAISGPTVMDNGALVEMGKTVLRFKKS